MGTHTVDKFIPLMVPNLQEVDIQAAVAVLRSGMLVQGQKVEAFEKVVADWIGTKYAVAASNGTATLHMALIALGVKPGDEIIVPAFSYIATANVVELVDAMPVFVDIDLTTFNIQVDAIEEKITPKTKGIIPVHEFGLACDIHEVRKIADKHNLFVLEDAACALGAEDNNVITGKIGHIASFSFHPRKAISSGEGGILTTNDESLASKIKILRNHGIANFNGKMEFVEAGFNYRMTDFQAALVHSQFYRLPAIIIKKNELASLYLEHLNHPLIQLPTKPENKNHTWQTFHVVLDSSVDRDKVIEEMKNKGIGVNLGAQCIPCQIYYQNKYKLDCRLHFPNALSAFSHGLALPLYEKLENKDVIRIADALFKTIDKLC